MPTSATVVLPSTDGDISMVSPSTTLSTVTEG
jgi:hypothetical protein